MGATKARFGRFGLGMWLLGSLAMVDAVWAQGEVSFIARQDFRVGTGPRSVAVGDFNGDGRQDLATANGGATSVSILLGRGDGTFQAAQDFAVGAFPLAITVGDFNGDGWQDVATANFEPSEEPTSGTVSILLGRGDGTFEAAQNIGVGMAAEPFSIAVGDFNGDGRQDLATANGSANSVSILLGRGDGTFQAAPDVAVGAFPQSITVGDFNSDGWQDVATANFLAATVSILLGRGDGTFQAAPDVAVGVAPFSITVGDFDGDGRQDLATANGGPDSVSILLGQGDGTFQAAPDVPVGAGPRSVAVGDFDGDGRQDLATANFDAISVSILLGQGDGTFQAAQDFGVGAFPLSITVGDFNGDGRQDVATANFQDATVSVLLNNTSGVVVNDLVTFDPIQSTVTPYPTGCPPVFVGTFSVEARLTNVSEFFLSDLGVAVTTLSNGNLLQNADGGPGGVGARMTVPRKDGFADGVLSPDEYVDVPFIICLREHRTFTFVVDVVGAAESRHGPESSGPYVWLP